MQMMYDRGGLLKTGETLQRLRQASTAEWTWEELETYLRFFKRRRDGTINTRVRHLRFMAERAAPPVQLWGPQIPKTPRRSPCAHHSGSPETGRKQFRASGNPPGHHAARSRAHSELPR